MRADDAGTPGGGGRTLAIDPGERRVGLAVSDPDGHVALGLPTFEAGHGRNFVDHLRGLLQAYGVTRIVVGHPRMLSGERGGAARRSETLARRLRSELGLPVALWDERLTTVESERLLRGTGAPKGARDRMAATLILQGYLDRQASPQDPGPGSSAEPGGSAEEL
jgi:putative Holliday junction resolvase